MKTLLSGELARLAGVSRDTLRFYERMGVLKEPLRSENGYRRYPPEALQRVELIRGALAAGFRVDELGPILRARDNGLAPCLHVRDLAAQRLAEMEERKRELGRMCAELRKTLEHWERRIRCTKSGAQARLLETLTEKPPKRRHLAPPFASRGRKLDRGERR